MIITRRLALLATLAVCMFAPVSSDCPDSSWHNIGVKCIKVYNQDFIKFGAARRRCQGEGGDLIQIRNDAESRAVKGKLHNFLTYWIGVNDPDNDKTFTYVDGSTLLYTNWYSGEPKNIGKCRCVQLTPDGKWRDVPCDSINGFVCQAFHTYSNEKCHDKTWHNVGRKCIKVYNNEFVSFDAARTICKNGGGDLVQMRNDLEAAIVKGQLHNLLTYWIGVHDPNHDKTYNYVDNKTLTYMKWSKDEPDNRKGVQHCVQMDGKGNMSDVDCKSINGLVCEVKHPVLKSCPSRWRNGGPDFCVKAFTFPNNINFWKGRDYCRGLNAELVSIRNDAQNNIIKDLVHLGRTHFSGPGGRKMYNLHEYWIGTIYDPKDKRYEYMNGKKASYSKPYVGKGGTRNHKSPCVALSKTYHGTWTDHYCATKNSGIVCQYDLNEYGCFAGWAMMDDVCVKAFNGDKVRWLQASRSCDFHGGRLLEIRSDADNKKAISVTSKDKRYWSGAKKIQDTSTKEWAWKYTSGAPVSYTNWAIGKPSGSPNEQCAEIRFPGSDGLWNDIPCDFKANFVCQMSRAIVKKSCESGWTTMGNTCIKAFGSPMKSWHGARTACKKQGGELVEILSNFEESVVFDLINDFTYMFWMSANDLQKEGTWEFIRGNPLIHTSWDPLEPNGGTSKNCALISPKSSRWRSYSCDYRANYVCQKLRVHSGL